MSADEFDRAKTGRFRVPEEPGATAAADEDEDTATRENPTRPPAGAGSDDPAFDKRKTQIFRRPSLPAEPPEPDQEREPATGEYERTKTARFRRRSSDAD